MEAGLPSEVWLHIFALAAPGGFTDHLRQTCTRWRAILDVAAALPAGGPPALRRRPLPYRDYVLRKSGVRGLVSVCAGDAEAARAAEPPFVRAAAAGETRLMLHYHGMSSGTWRTHQAFRELALFAAAASGSNTCVVHAQAWLGAKERATAALVAVWAESVPVLNALWHVSNSLGVAAMRGGAPPVIRWLLKRGHKFTHEALQAAIDNGHHEQVITCVTFVKSYYGDGYVYIDEILKIAKYAESQGAADLSGDLLALAMGRGM